MTEPRALDVPPALSLNCVAAFVAVATHRSFRKAAERLYMDASTASKLVRQLERELGQPLLTRTTREVRLTPEGEAALTVAKRLLRESERLVTAVQRAS
jgi:LysR family carnitine catabolism transcriptional activator